MSYDTFLAYQARKKEQSAITQKAIEISKQTGRSVREIEYEFERQRLQARLAAFNQIKHQKPTYTETRFTTGVADDNEMKYIERMADIDRRKHAMEVELVKKSVDTVEQLRKLEDHCLGSSRSHIRDDEIRGGLADIAPKLASRIAQERKSMNTDQMKKELEEAQKHDDEVSDYERVRIPLTQRLHASRKVNHFTKEEWEGE